MASEESAFNSVRARDTYALLKSVLCGLRDSDPERFAVKLRKALDLFFDGNQDGAWPLDHLVHLLYWVIGLPESSSKKKQYFPSNEIAPSILAENPNMWLSRVELRDMSETMERTVTERTEDRLFHVVAKKLTTIPAPFVEFDCVYFEWQKEQEAKEQTGEPSLFVDSDEDLNGRPEIHTSEPQLIQEDTNEMSDPGPQTPQPTSREASQARSEAPSTPEVSATRALSEEQRRALAAKRRRQALAQKPFVNVLNPSTPKRKRRRRDDDDNADDEAEDSDKERSSKDLRPFPSMFKPLTSSDRNKMRETDTEKLQRKITSLEKDLKMAVKFRNRLEQDLSTEKERMEDKDRQLNSVNDQLSYAKSENARLGKLNADLERVVADYKRQEQRDEHDYWTAGAF